MCLKRKKDIEQHCVLKEQFGGWLRVNQRRSEGWSNEGSGNRVASERQKQLQLGRGELSLGQGVSG